MKAIVYTATGGPEVLQLKELAKPVPQDNEIQVKIYTSAVTAVDMGYRRSMGRESSNRTRTHNLGYYLAGKVEGVGKDVRRFQKGDEVYGGDVWSLGAYAEYKCVRETGVLVHKPASMTYEEAAALPYGGLTALPFLRDVGKVRKGQQVLIVGASGSIGTYAVQLARYFGAEVTGVCSTPHLDMVKSLGASQVIDYTRDDFTKNGYKYDIIFDIPAKYQFSRCKDSLTKNGKYLTTVPWPRVIVQMIWTLIASRKKAIFAPTGLRSARKKSRDLVFLNRLVEEGEIKPVIDKIYPMEEIVQAHRYVETGHRRGTVVIQVAHEEKLL